MKFRWTPVFCKQALYKIWVQDVSNTVAVAAQSVLHWFYSGVTFKLRLEPLLFLGFDVNSCKRREAPFYVGCTNIIKLRTLLWRFVCQRVILFCFVIIQLDFACLILC